MNTEKEEILTLQKRIEILENEKIGFKNNEQMFHALVETAVGDIGQDFFNHIVIKLSAWLKAECVIIGKVLDGNRVEALPMYLDGKIIHGYSYELKGTPCDLTTKKGYCTYENNVIHLFPEDKDLVDIKAEGYVGAALYNKNGEPNGVLCAISRNKLDLPPQAEDIMRIIGARVTSEIERTKTQTALKISERKLKESNMSKDKFFSIIAHDLKAPFNSLLGFSELLVKEIQSNNLVYIKKYAHLIHKVSNQSYSLLNNLLDWSLAQTGGMKFNPEKVNFTEMSNELIDYFKNIAQNKKISIKSTINSNLELVADRNMLTTIIRNLLSNAIKYTPQDGEITISATKDIKETNISIKDTGVGIKTEDLGKLFKIEEASSTRGTENEKGTGLGLILCCDLVEKHNGKIWVESKVGSGSLFSFTIPRI